jgi:hypothetical protein
VKKGKNLAINCTGTGGKPGISENKELWQKVIDNTEAEVEKLKNK